ncbi:MAG: GGDEF domain-containing protein [Spirochaetes bacterium]|nr:GGDEF domain-containing protein [Spirochaetota bacterium]
MLQITVLVIIIQSMFAAYLLGWESNFGLYLITSGIIIVNSLSMNLKWKIIEASLISFLLILLYLNTRNNFHIYAIKPMIIETVGLLNIINVAFTLLFMSFRNFVQNDFLQKELKDQSEKDGLTGAYNRRFFNEYLDIEIRRQNSQIKYKLNRNVNFGIAILDIDNFKKINDEFGHLAGDDVLVDVVRIIKTALFERDILCRYGGEEFVILFTSTSREGAIKAIEKIRKLVEDNYFYLDEKNPKKQMTISIGFASFDEESDIYKLLELADKRLYKAKQTGKNQVIYN